MLQWDPECSLLTLLQLLTLSNMMLFLLKYAVLHSYYLTIAYLTISLTHFSQLGMNAAVRAVVRMGIYVGAKVYFIREVSVSTKCQDSSHATWLTVLSSITQAFLPQY